MTRTGGINAVSSSMTTRNKYVKRSRISEKKFRQLVKLFSLDLDAIQISELSHLNRNTVTRYLKAIRNRITQFCEVESPVKGEVEIDESYFGAKRVKGKRGRGASGKTIVFGIFQRNGEAYTEIVPDARRKTLQNIIRGREIWKLLFIQMAGVDTLDWLI